MPRGKSFRQGFTVNRYHRSSNERIALFVSDLLHKVTYTGFYNGFDFTGVDSQVCKCAIKYKMVAGKKGQTFGRLIDQKISAR